MKRYIVGRVHKEYVKNTGEATFIATFDDENEASYLVGQRNAQPNGQYWYFVLELPK